MVLQEDKTIQEVQEIMQEIFENEKDWDHQMKRVLEEFGYIDLRKFARDHGLDIVEVSQVIDRLMERDSRLFRIYTLGNQKIVRRG